MHKKYAKEGLAVISVTLDDKADKKIAHDMLKKWGADCTNLLLDEETDFWQNKLNFIAPPCLYVFNRQGKWVRFASDEEVIDYKKVDALVEKFLREK